jgi:hypothetical protein
MQQEDVIVKNAVEARQKLYEIILPYINKGATLKDAAKGIGIAYDTLKGRIRRHGIKYPDSETLRNNYCLFHFGMEFVEYLKFRKIEKRSNRYIARELGIEACTLYIQAAKHAVDITSKDYKLDEAAAENINRAKRQRIRTTSTAHLITYNGETKTLSEWSSLYGIDRGALRRRLVDLKWGVEEALTTKSGETRKSKAMQEGKGALSGNKPKAVKKARLDPCRRIYEKLIQNSTIVEDEYCMVRVLEDSRVKDKNIREEIENGDRYLDRRGRGCSLDKGSVVRSIGIANAYVEYIASTKRKSAVYSVEKYCITSDVSEYDATTDWAKSIKKYFDECGFETPTETVLNNYL